MKGTNARTSRWALRLGGVLIFVACLMWLPAAAWAHAAFVDSQPEPGERLGSAPGVVVLRFTEPLNVRLSTATVMDPTGGTFVGRASPDEAIRVPLSSNALGIYVVRWSTVSTVDGHTLHGSFRFGVGVAPGADALGETVAAPRPTDFLIAAARSFEYLALLVATGMLLLARLARRDPPLVWVRPAIRAALAIALVGGIAVVAGEALAAAGGPSLGAVANYLTTGLPGLARLVRLLLEAVAVAVAFLGVRYLWLPIGGALVALAAAGHAAAVRPLWWGVSVDAMHLLSAGLWAGGILALAATRPPSGWRGAEVRVLLDRFSPVAIPAFLITVGAGVLRSFQELSRPADLVATSYGLTLSAKIVAVAAMVPLSVLAWRRLAGSPRLEAGLAVAVVGAAAILAAYPLPPGRVAEAESGAHEAAASSALPQPGDVTLGGDAGQVLVGLTLRPGTPGPNQILVYLLPLDGEDAAGSLSAHVFMDDSPLVTRTCEATCRQAGADLDGGEVLDVRVAGPIGGTASFRVPPLPAKDGSALLAAFQRRMHELRTYRQEETLSSGLAVVRSSYAFEAPDRYQTEVSTGTRVVVIGDTRYLKQKPADDWMVEKGGPVTEVPAFIWDFFRPLTNTRVLGRATVEGRSTSVVAFFGKTGEFPVWFRVWVDSEGLVRRAEMRAQGHFMDHRYFDFDALISIEAPGP